LGQGVFKYYRHLSSQILKPLLESRFFEKASERKIILEQAPPPKENPRIWFHASSVGELEMLTPVIEKWHGEKVITIFSESAEKSLKILTEQQRLQAEKAHLENPGAVIFTGYCPWEGEWRKALEIFQPDLFMSARYEAWPELWTSLGELKIPLAVVGAQSRTSLRVAKNVVKALGGELPEMFFFSVEEMSISDLVEGFPDSKVTVTGDPRWERVAKRASKGNARAKELVARFKDANRPWGVLGSAWDSDLEFLGSSLFEIPGTIWIVPHKVDSEHLTQIETRLKSFNIQFARTSAAESSNGLRVILPVILVDEMGFLSELYSSADWAYVGGGFEKGIHNTIEPAIHGIPLACGPKRVERFPETHLLSSQGQLQILRSEKDFLKWKSELVSGELGRLKAAWKSQVEQQMGASERILTSLRDVLALRAK
jgi:3-deoxy-D-manno-octulosonic-acid transferase